MEHYIHQVPGRLRIKNPEIKNNPGMARDMQACLLDAVGVERVTVNSVTGSVIINYDPDVLADDRLVAVLEECEYLDTSKAVTLNQCMQSKLTDVGTKVGKLCLGMLVEQGLKRTGLSFLAVLI